MIVSNNLTVDMLDLYKDGKEPKMNLHFAYYSGPSCMYCIVTKNLSIVAHVMYQKDLKIFWVYLKQQPRTAHPK
jgi:hypothetical protein